MGRRLSQGIRIYEHVADHTQVSRDSYNFWQGMSEIEALRADPSVEVFAVGTESGAMTVHFRWLH